MGNRAPILLWTLAFVTAALILSSTDYRSQSFDSKFYTRLVGTLAAAPADRWIAPKWGENYYGEPPDEYIRDHLVGNLIPGVLLVRAGVPSRHALHIVQMGWQILCLYLLVWIAAEFVPRRRAQGLLWTLQLTPIAVIYGIRANQEQSTLFFTLLAVYGAVRMARDPRWVLLLAAGINGVFLTKGLFVVAALAMAAVAHAASAGVSWRRAGRGLLLLGLAGLTVVVAGWLYEQAYRSATGLPFFSEYWRVQIVERSLQPESELPWLIQKAANFAYYLSRVGYYALPWSAVALVFACLPQLRKARRPRRSGRRGRYLALMLATTLTLVLLFSYSDRTASRYIFPAFYLAGAAAAVVALSHGPRLRRLHARILARGVHTVAASIWLLSFLGQLVAWWAKNR